MDRPNFLIVSLEDLNDWIEPLGGHPDAVTPNLNRLAARAAVFESANSAAPACSPSRTATLFSRFPWESGVYGNKNSWYQAFSYGKAQSLFGQLKANGYPTYGTGKIFHAIYKSQSSVAKIDASDWNEYHAARMYNQAPKSKSVQSGDLGPMSDFGIDDSGEPSFDDINTDWLCDRIQPGATGQVWALGVFRPHLPFIVPKKYFDMIPDHVRLPPGLSANMFDPDDERSLKGLGESGRLFSKRNAKTGRVLHDHNEYHGFLRAYLASIAYSDSKLGQVLDRLEACGLDDNTVIVLWSDHGWQLGEKLAFRKFTLWERAVRVPMMIAGPGIKPRRIREPVSLVDMAPTILSLAGVPAYEGFSGQDLAPLLRGDVSEGRGYAASVWSLKVKKQFNLSFSIRTEGYRYIRYWNAEEELYRHADDPFEHDNLMKQFRRPAEVEAVLTKSREIALEIARNARAPDFLNDVMDDGEDD